MSDSKRELETSNQGMEECDDISMINNVGSVSGEELNLSDVDEPSLLEDDKLTILDAYPPQSPSNTDVTHSGTSQLVDVCNQPSSTSMQSLTCEHLSTNQVTDVAKSCPTTSDAVVTSHPTVSDETSNLANNEIERVQTDVNHPESTNEAATGESIYIDNGYTKEDRKVVQPKRMTMAQRAAMEALASFGGCDLGSVPVRKIDLHEELKVEADEEKKKRELEMDDKEDESEEQPPSKRPRTRLQVAQQEAEQVFKDISLADGRKKHCRVYNLKANRPQRSVRSKVKVRTTRVDKAKKEALEAFGGVPLDSLKAKDEKNKSKVSDPEETSAQSGRRLTRVERARLEAMQAFGGGELADVMSGAKKRIARTLEEKKEVKGENDSKKLGQDKENVDDCQEQMVTAGSE